MDETNQQSEMNGDAQLTFELDEDDKPMFEREINVSPVFDKMQELNDDPIIASPQANETAEKSQTPPTLESDESPLHKETSPLQVPKTNKSSSKARSKDADLIADASETSSSVSWHIPHPIFVIILVGPEEIPFGIQKDVLCAQSPYYREEFEKSDQQIEYIVKLPDTDIDTFGCFQNFIYTGSVYDRQTVAIPDYPLLMSVWKLATKLRMAPLRISVLDVMNERRQQTSCIPGTPLLVQAWKETEEGSGLRTMLITWAAEHMRTSPEIRNVFAKSLPQEILSELVIAMSELSTNPTPHPFMNYTPAPATPRSMYQQLPYQRPHHNNHAHPNSQPYSGAPLEIDTRDAIPHPPSSRPANPNKRPRKSDVGFNLGDNDAYEAKPKKVARRSDGSVNRRKSKAGASAENSIPMTSDREMNFCRDLIFRMLSGPGYWTRLVGPFRNPVDPVADNVPNYFAVVKRPMDLITVKNKMAEGKYETSEEFEADVRLIFQNCYEYWTEKDQIFNTCVAFEKYFNDKWNARHKWVAPTIKSEAMD